MGLAENVEHLTGSESVSNVAKHRGSDVSRQSMGADDLSYQDVLGVLERGVCHFESRAASGHAGQPLRAGD